MNETIFMLLFCLYVDSYGYCVLYLYVFVEHVKFMFIVGLDIINELNCVVQADMIRTLYVSIKITLNSMEKYMPKKV